ncbi:MAG: alpha-galactosidase [Actinobacteria bacterium HGW-Actinobacteria-4]|nr:MAG: alpha-galactosidase [Actinobacteria bacterium HGW-Actinobacteria-4]
MSDLTSTTVHLRAAGVSLVVDVSQHRLPRIVHWGEDLGDLDEVALSALMIASTEPSVGGELDARYPVAILPEHSWGWMGTPGLSGHRDGRDHSTRFDVSTVDLTASGNTTGQEPATQRLTVQAADAVAQLDLALTIEMLGSGLVRARASVTSTGHGSSGVLGAGDAGSGEVAESPRVAPYTLDGLHLMFPVPREATELLDFTGRWIRERTPQRAAFSVGAHVREARRGKPGHDSAFVVSAGQPGFGFRRGQVWSTHVAWSGNSRTIAERTNAGVGLVGGGELMFPGEVQLAVGETYQGPWVYGSYGDGLDQMSSRFHRYLRSRPDHPHRPRPVIVNTWEAVYFDHDHAKLYALADAAAEVGAERFVLDDGWFNHRRSDNAGLGDWYVDRDVYPEGLGPLADYVRSKGMEFGLWVEPEMINPDSDLARLHPEWIAQPTPRPATAHGGGRLPLEARRQQVLDLTHPEAYAYIAERLHALVADIKPAYLKWDHNRDLLEAGSTLTGRAVGHLQTLAYYRLLDGLRSAFPGLEIESCAGGGGRVDIEVLEHAHRIWTSDTNDALERQRMQRYTGLLVPPEMMGAHIGPPTAHTTGRTQTLDFRAGTAIWGHLGIEWNVAGPEASEPATRAALSAWVALYKQFRQLLHTGTVVRSDLPVTGRVLHGVVAPDLSEALYCFASTDSVAESPTGQICLEGLDPAVTYRVSHVGPLTLSESGSRAVPPWWSAADAGGPVELSGHVLATHGIQAPGLFPEEVALIHLVRAA